MAGSNLRMACAGALDTLTLGGSSTPRTEERSRMLEPGEYGCCVCCVCMCCVCAVLCVCAVCVLCCVCVLCVCVLCVHSCVLWERTARGNCRGTLTPRYNPPTTFPKQPSYCSKPKPWVKLPPNGTTTERTARARPACPRQPPPSSSTRPPPPAKQRPFTKHTHCTATCPPRQPTITSHTHCSGSCVEHHSRKRPAGGMETAIAHCLGRRLEWSM